MGPSLLDILKKTEDEKIELRKKAAQADRDNAANKANTASSTDLIPILNLSDSQKRMVIGQGQLPPDVRLLGQSITPYNEKAIESQISVKELPEDIENKLNREILEEERKFKKLKKLFSGE